MRGKRAKALMRTAEQICMEKKITLGQGYGKYLRNKSTGQIMTAHVVRQVYKGLKRQYDGR